VQEIPAPPLANPRDLRQLVADTGRNQNPPPPHDLSTGQANDEPGLDRHHLILDQLTP
jgi:hypothetical protein